MHYGKQEIYDLLKEKGIEYKAYEHEAVYTMEGVEALGLPKDGIVAKNLFLRDGKKKNFYLVVVATEDRIDLKELGTKLEIKGVSFASEKYLDQIMGIYAGAVTPLGVLNDVEHKVRVFFDDRFKENDLIGVHPNDNTASVYLKVSDLVSILSAFGTEVNYVTI